jgi:hypothetical protein
MSRSIPGRPASAAAGATPSPRENAGAMAPGSLISSSSPGASASGAKAAPPHFEKRTAPAPELPGLSEWIGKVNPEERPPQAVLADLREARSYFAGLRAKGEQTAGSDGTRTQTLINPILRSENARTPGLNAAGCASEEKLGEALRELSKAGGRGREGHVRFHLGLDDDRHRMAVDAFQHREGGFTLVAVDSLREPVAAHKMAALERMHPDLIKGVLVIPTPNQAHSEGCRIFAVHTLNALHDFQPHIQGLHRQLYGKGMGKPAPGLSGAEWKRMSGNTHVLDDKKGAFGILPGKFFKHMQVKNPKAGKTRTLLDDAEAKNPALKNEPVNKKGQTLRERFASQNPAKDPADFSRADRTASLDNKRLVLIDRAIAHYEKQ